MLFFLFCMPFIVAANTITSTTTGGYWNVTTTWVGGVIPGSADNAIIATTTGHYVTVNSTVSVVGVTVNSGASLSITNILTVGGLFVNNGSVVGTNNLTLTGSGTVLSGGGSWSSHTGYIIMQNANQVIDASVNMSKTGGEIELNTSTLGGNIKVTNNGSITLSSTTLGRIVNSSSSHSATWINAANSFLSVAAASFTDPGDTLYASATGNTVVFAGGDITLTNPIHNTFYNLTIAASLPLTMLSNLTCNSVTVNSGSTLNMGGDSLFISGTWSHPGTVIDHPVTTNDTSVVKVAGAIVQKIPPVGYRITSKNTTGEWEITSLWIGNLEPGLLDTAVIAGSNIESVPPITVAKVIVNSGATLSIGGSNYLGVSTVLINNGSITNGGSLYLSGSGTVLSGGGSWSGNTGTINFEGTNQVIDASVNINKPGQIVLNTTAHGVNVKVTNNGSVTLSSNISNNGYASHSSTWINAANASVSVGGASWASTRDTLYASATGNTVTYAGTTAYNLKVPVGGNYYNLAINSTNTISLPAAITVNNNLTISGGTLNCSTFQITGNSSGTLSMASGTNLILGLTTSTTVPIFPLNYTTAHISLDPNSTITYQAKAAQALSSTPSYGNLVLSTGTSASTKTTSGSFLTVAGNLTINSNTTLTGIGSGTLTLGGTLTNNGIYTISTGNTTVFNGAGTQTISGTIPSFYNLTIANTGTGKLTMPNSLTITNNLSISSGILDATSSNYNLTIGGSFTNSGGTFLPQGNTVTLNGGSPTLGGGSTIALNKLIIGTSGTTTLGGNITTASDITINSGATFNASSYNINIGGNFADNGTFHCNTSTVDFDNSGKQCISGHSTETFNNLTVSYMSILGTSCSSININGTTLVLPGGEMVCACN